MLKNIIIINDFDYIQGGASKVAIDTANILKENNPELNIYFFSGAHNKETILRKNIVKICTNQGEALKDKNKIRGFLNGLYNIKAKNELKKLLKTLNNQETIIHVHGWTKCLSSSIFTIAFKMKFKLILTMHDYFTACPNGGYFNYKKNEICTFSPLSIKCIKCKCDSRNQFFKIYRIIRQLIQNKIVKLPQKLENVISISEFSEKILKKTLNLKTRIYRVYNPIKLEKTTEIQDYKKNKYYIYVVRLSKEKGVDIFCEAIKKSGKKGLIVGDGPEMSILKEKYPDIEYVGWKKSDQVSKYMKCAKALIFPSRWYEASPLVPLESMQYKIPAISSDCNAAIDYIIKENRFHNVDDLTIMLKNETYKENFKNIDYNLYNSENYYKTLYNVFEKINKGEN